MNYERYKEKYHFSINFYSIFLIATSLPDILHVNDSIFKYTYWTLKILFCLWIFSQNKLYNSQFSSLEKLFVILSILYAIHIFVDAFINPLYSVADKEHKDFFGFCINFLLALSFRYDSAYHSKKSFKFFCISLTIGLAFAYFFAKQNWDLDGNYLRYDANSTVNSIIYGQMGLALSLVSIFGLVNYKKAFLKLLFIILFMVGILSIAKAGSRSPVVVLIIVTVFFFIARFGGFKAIIIFSLLGGLIVVYMNSIIGLFESMGSSLSDRLTKTIVAGSTGGRDDIYSNVINIIKGSPILGEYYLVPHGAGAGSYPHNFFLEAFMATGVLGGIPFVILTFYTLIKSYKLLHSKHPASWIVLLYLQIVGYGMFSTGLYSSQDYWMLLFYMLSAPGSVMITVNEQSRIAIVNESHQTINSRSL